MPRGPHSAIEEVFDIAYDRILTLDGNYAKRSCISSLIKKATYVAVMMMKMLGLLISDITPVITPEINNKMSDDIKVVLAEYRLALKKYKAERKDKFRDRNK